MSLRAIPPAFSLLCALASATFAQPLTLSVDASAPGKAISPELVGIFFEDINYAADGGLYAELVQNRSFEYSQLARSEWNHFTAWEIAERGGRGSLDLEGAFPIHPNNPHYGVLLIRDAGPVALVNGGFDGIAVRAGESYDLSFFGRRLFTKNRRDETPLPLIARIESKDGAVLAETELKISARAWERVTATFTPAVSDDTARLVLIASVPGGIALDEVSLFPRNTFKNRPNGLRADLAQAIADLKPKFMRFPGGCLVHGSGVPNFYRWKDTIGPIEQRRQQHNLWGYHQTVGLGYFEYFQFCEDLGAIPIPVVPAGVSCQNSGHVGHNGQSPVPLGDMPAYIQEVLDLIEWANGPATSTWGAKRAAAGRAEPFGLKYLGIGNEDRITPEFDERFRLINAAVKAKHPEIVVIGTSGPASDGEDFVRGWRLADTLQLPMVDEHYYKPPQWFWDNLKRYDSYDRAKSAIYLGEYAAHDNRRGSTLRAALAEAAYLTAMERNADIVRFASYAPLLAKHGHTQWRPDLIYFNNTQIFPTLSYEVQKLFSLNSGDHWVDSRLTTTHGGTEAALPRDLAHSTVRDSASGDIIIKIVNGATEARLLHVALSGVSKLPARATRTLFAGTSLDVVNLDGRPPAVRPETTSVPISPGFDYEVPACSLTLFRIPSR